MVMPLETNGNAVPALFPGTAQVVVITGTSISSGTFGADTVAIEIAPDTTCYVRLGTGTATTAGTASFNTVSKAGVVYTYSLREGYNTARMNSLGVLTYGTGTGSIIITELR